MKGEEIKDLVTQALCDQSLGSSVGTYGARFTREEAHYIQRAIPVVTQAILAALARERGQGREFIAHDHPAANSRIPLSGDIDWTFRFTLEDGAELRVKVGETGYRAFESMFIENREADYQERDTLHAHAAELEERIIKIQFAAGAEATELEQRAMRAETLAEWLEKVVEAARRWKVRQGHGADGHQCDLCDALADLDAMRCSCSFPHPAHDQCRGIPFDATR